MADFTVRYADFKGGSYGNRDPSKANNDTWDGTNVVPYDSGLLGIRAGTKELVTTGIPAHTVVPGPLGFSADGTNLIVNIGTRNYQVPTTGGAATGWAPYPSTPTRPIVFAKGGGITYTLSNGVLYKHPGTGTTTAITTPAPLNYFVRWGYYFVGVDANIPWRIWFSTVDAAGAHFDTWGANDYLDIGDTEPITALQPIYNILYVGKVTGWNAVSGVLGTLASVRGVVLGNGPVDPRLTTVTTDNRVLYWSLDGRPTWFNGERVYIDTAMDVGQRNTPYPCSTVIVTPTARRLFMAAEHTDPAELPTHILTWASSAWSHFHFPTRIAGLVPNTVATGSGLPPDVIYAVAAPTTVGDPVRIASFNHSLDRPGHTGDAYSAPIDVGGTDLVSGEVTFPTYWEPIGRQVRVRSVVVQFRKWSSGVAGAFNRLALRVDSLGAYGRGDNVGDVQSWTEPCERSSSDGTDESWRVNVGQQGYGNGFRISFPTVVGVALREVIALADVRTERV